MWIRCEYCSTDNSDDRVDCLKCGAPLKHELNAAPQGLVARTKEAIYSLLPSAEWQVVGVDVSHWQGNMDWEKTKQFAQYAKIRAGYGNAERDGQLDANRADCHEVDMPFGLYWFVKPSKDWRKHASSFASIWKEDKGDLPPTADIEVSDGLSKSELSNWIEKFVKEFEYQAGRQLMIYTSSGWWNANMPQTNWAKNRKLWVANWTNAPAPTLPDEWVNINNPRTWEFWQWQVSTEGAKYGAGSSKIDLNRYHFSIADFNAEYGTHIVPLPDQPPPQPPPTSDSFTITASWLNGREEPTSDVDNRVLTIRNGQQVQWAGEEWGDWLKVSYNGEFWMHKKYLKGD